MPASTSERRTILVVEDDLDFAGQVTLDLTNRGYDVGHAASRAQALASLSRETPDLLVVDRTLPDGDGLSIISELRERAARIGALFRRAHDAR